MDQPPPERKVFVIAFDSDTPESVVAKIGTLGQSIELRPGLIALASEWSAGEIAFALDPFVVPKHKPLFVIETTHMQWRKEAVLDIDAALLILLAGSTHF